MSILTARETEREFEYFRNLPCPFRGKSHVCHCLAETPLGIGGCRLAFPGRWCPHGNLKRSGKCVVKKWTDQHIFEANFWDGDLKAHDIVKSCVDNWNRMGVVNKAYSITVPVRTFVKNEAKGSKCKYKEYVLIEDYLEGNWTKFNSNSGDNCGMSDLSVQAFSHWTYDRR